MTLWLIALGSSFAVPAMHPEAVVQVYAGRPFGWRGAFAVHTWLAAKPKNTIGWNARADARSSRFPTCAYPMPGGTASRRA